MQLLSWLAVAWGLLWFASLKNKEALFRPECRSSAFWNFYVLFGSIALAMLLMNQADRPEQQRRYRYTPEPNQIQNLGWRGEQ